MTNAVQLTIETCREKGIYTISTSTHSNWEQDEHNDMLILQANPPKDIRVSLNIKFGVHDWTLVRIGERKPEPIHGTKTQDYTLQIGFDMLRSQKEGLLRILNDDNNKEAVEAFHLEGIIALIDEIQDQAVDKHGLPEKEVFHLSDEPETANEKMEPIRQEAAAETSAMQFDTFSAYQHFLYYFDLQTFRKEMPFGQRMTDHFVGKLSNLDIKSLVYWVQHMSHDNQFILLGYILKHHSNKW